MVVEVVVGGLAGCGRGWNDLRELVVDGGRACEELKLLCLYVYCVLAPKDVLQKMSRCSFSIYFMRP